jgi:thiamine kinase-like enzyme
MELDPALEHVIAAVPAWEGHQVTAVEPLTSGITNANYKVSFGNEAFVVRLMGKDTDLLGIDRAAEEEAGRAAHAAGVGPEVFAALPVLGALVTRFVEGTNIPQEDLADEQILSSVVRSVKRIHGCPPIRSSFPVFRIVEEYQELAVERGVPVPAAYDEAHHRADLIEAAFSKAPMPLTTCHNDLLNANLLRDGDHTWIVDYEYAGMGDVFFDLGNLSINNGLELEAQELLLRLYFRDVRDGYRARHGLMRIMSDFREAMWGVVQQALSTLDFDYVDYADRHFARLLSSADDPRVADWLEAAAEPV